MSKKKLRERKPRNKKKLKFVFVVNYHCVVGIEKVMGNFKRSNCIITNIFKNEHIYHYMARCTHLPKCNCKKLKTNLQKHYQQIFFYYDQKCKRNL